MSSIRKRKSAKQCCVDFTSPALVSIERGEEPDDRTVANLRIYLRIAVAMGWNDLRQRIEAAIGIRGLPGLDANKESLEALTTFNSAIRSNLNNAHKGE